jgi:Tfp pilus assembly protein PilF
MELLGLVYLEEHELTKAEAMLRGALAGRERFLGPKHRDTNESVKCLAMSFHLQGKLAEAEEWYQSAPMGFKDLYGPGHVETLEV